MGEYQFNMGTRVPPRSLDAEIARRANQLRAISELGQAALTGLDISILIGQTCALVEEVLTASRAAIVEQRADGTWAPRFSIGNRVDFSTCDELDPRHRALLLYALGMGEPTAFRNLAAEPRFDGEHLLSVHGVQSGVAVRIAGREHPFGLLIVYSAQDRTFAPDELEFVQSVADLVGSMIDRARAEDALAASEQRFRALVENSSDGILLIDESAVILYAGPSTARILGHGDDLIGKRVDESIHPDDIVNARLFHSQLVAGAGTTIHGEVRIRHADGRWRSIEAVANNLLHDPAVAAIVINYRDVTDRKDAERQLERLAYRDSLTDLPNRFLFHDRLRHAIDQAQRRAHGLAVLYLDLDRFKLVNDTLGHSVGDELLQAVSTRLRGVLRADDTIARLGGDEFAILLPEVDRPEDAGSVAGKVLTALRAPFTVGDHQLYATASIGLSIYPTDGEDVVTLLKNADSALYRSKELGRNNVQLFAASMNARYMRRLDLEVALRTAIEREELEMHYQPIVDRRTGTIRSFEALMRWRRDGVLISPAAFIGIAEETGLILPMGDWALNRACEDLRRWRDGGAPEFGVAVNLSAHQLQQRDCIARIHDAIMVHGLDPADLELEVTESAALQNLQWTLSVLDQLRSLGVKIAVDDFGTGQSSLAYLKRFPLHTVKMDREFLRDLANESDVALLESIVRLGHSLNLYVIAEGIETPEELALLESQGCDGLQGYYFARPMPADLVPDFVARFRAPESLTTPEGIAS